MADRSLGYITYRGPSALDGAPIVSILTGFGAGASASHNPKTGPMIQQWIIRSRVHPADALRDGRERSICGDCPLSRSGSNDGVRRCYVNPLTPISVYRAYHAGRYVYGFPESLPYALRMGAYGDPAALPAEHVRELAALAEWSGYGHTGYTHQWRERRVQGLRGYLMASCETLADVERARRLGWRTFRIGTDGAHLGEIVCPASAEAGKRTQCARCGLCDGRVGAADQRKSIVIAPHGRVALGGWV